MEYVCGSLGAFIGIGHDVSELMSFVLVGRDNVCVLIELATAAYVVQALGRDRVTPRRRASWSAAVTSSSGIELEQ
jgi:hypothetical protein